jgi:hypothetical protein
LDGEINWPLALLFSCRYPFRVIMSEGGQRLASSELGMMPGTPLGSLELTE